MEKKDYHRTITVNSSAEEAMKKIGQVNLWWAKNFKGTADKLDDKFRYTLGIRMWISESPKSFRIKKLLGW